MAGRPAARFPRQRCRRAAMAMAAVAILVAACASGTTSHAPRGTVAVKTRPTPEPAHHPSGLRSERLPELPSTVNLKPLRWRLMTVTGDGKTLHLAVTWSCGLAPIGQRVSQNPSSVTIIIYGHRLPARSACAPALGSAIVTVHLATPLASRRLLQ